MAEDPALDLPLKSAWVRYPWHPPPPQPPSPPAPQPVNPHISFSRETSLLPKGTCFRSFSVQFLGLSPSPSPAVSWNVWVFWARDAGNVTRRSAKMRNPAEQDRPVPPPQRSALAGCGSPIGIPMGKCGFCPVAPTKPMGSSQWLERQVKDGQFWPCLLFLRRKRMAVQFQEHPLACQSSASKYVHPRCFGVCVSLFWAGPARATGGGGVHYCAHAAVWAGAVSKARVDGLGPEQCFVDRHAMVGNELGPEGVKGHGVRQTVGPMGVVSKPPDRTMHPDMSASESIVTVRNDRCP